MLVCCVFAELMIGLVDNFALWIILLYKRMLYGLFNYRFVLYGYFYCKFEVLCLKMKG